MSNDTGNLNVLLLCPNLNFYHRHVCIEKLRICQEVQHYLWFQDIHLGSSVRIGGFPPWTPPRIKGDCSQYPGGEMSLREPSDKDENDETGMRAKDPGPGPKGPEGHSGGIQVEESPLPWEHHALHSWCLWWEKKAEEKGI